MNVEMAYWGRSGLASDTSGSQSLSFAPNLRRDAVSFDAALLHPLRFREAMSALHDVVVSDLRYRPRDKSAYEKWKADEQQRQEALRRKFYQEAKKDILAKRTTIPEDFEETHQQALRRYWRLRDRYSRWLLVTDPGLWRLLTPCDPIVTVAEDVVFFECFSADESSYGCLTVQRDGGFGASAGMQQGTTNVDYSWSLYDHFQALRSYRETRLRVDPTGFEVATEGAAEYREEKIDLPDGWLRGFMQIQAAMGLPMRCVSLSREAVYSLLAWHKRHRADRSPRALRFELIEGKAPVLAMEPWERKIISHGTVYRGPSHEPIRIWGVRRLQTLARLLPLVERFDVYLLGTGLPSFWVAQMGEMRLTLGVSGWTTSDWTRGSAIDMLAPPATPSSGLIDRAADLLHRQRSATFEQLREQLVVDAGKCAAALNHLAHTGQVICDLSAGLYRWRQVMPMALGEAQLGPENEELAASRKLVAEKKVTIHNQAEAGARATLVLGEADGKPAELVLDHDGLIKRGKCVCSHHYRFGIRQGPCRHLLALRQLAFTPPEEDLQSESTWYERLCERI